MLRLWPTPLASDGEKPSGGNRRNADLTGSARRWATPSARDWRSGRASPATLARNSRPLNEQAVSRSPGTSGNLPSLPDPATPRAGGNTCAGDRTLNPLFVEALMGWPPGWTDPEPSAGGSTACGSAATAWSRWLRRMRGELSRLGWESPE
jgi:DNA (cytosine-5)-methyltransferase 1